MAKIETSHAQNATTDSSLEDQFEELARQYEAAAESGVFLTDSEYNELQRRQDELVQKLDDSISATEAKLAEDLFDGSPQTATDSSLA